MDTSFFATLIIGLVSLNFYTKHLISKKNLSASTDMPLRIAWSIVHRIFLIAVINNFELLPKKKEAKKESNNSNTFL